MDKVQNKSFNYAIGMFGTSIPINMLKTYAAFFYIDKLGLKAGEFALILLIYAFIDAADNLVYGFLSDRTRSRWGRRRPWLVIGTPLLVLGLIGFFNPPAGIAGNGLMAFCMLFYIFTGTLDSVINANYGALFPELFPDDASRAKTNAMRQAFQLVAMVISIALTPLVTKQFGYGMTSLVYGILGGSVILYMSLTTHETADVLHETKPGLIKSVAQLLSNPKFWIAGLTNAFYSAAMSLVLVALPFFVKYTLKLPDGQATILFATVLFFAIGCVPVWVFLMKKYSLMPVWRAALAALLVAFVPLYFADSLVSAVFGSLLVGFGFAGVITTMDLIGARIMDEDTAKYHVRREGIISNALGFMNRLNGLFTSLAFLLILKLFGFESGDVPGPVPNQAARFLMTVFPICMMILSLCISFFIHFPKMILPASAPEPAGPTGGDPHGTDPH